MMASFSTVWKGLSCGPVSSLTVSMFLSDVHLCVLVMSSFICCRAGEVGSLDLRSSSALILSNISAGTSSVLIWCHPKDICCDAAFRMMVCKSFLLFGSLLEAVLCSVCPLSPYDIGPSLPSLS